jgi:hypothetical protein
MTYAHSSEQSTTNTMRVHGAPCKVQCSAPHTLQIAHRTLHGVARARCTVHVAHRTFREAKRS